MPKRQKRLSLAVVGIGCLILCSLFGLICGFSNFHFGILIVLVQLAAVVMVFLKGERKPGLKANAVVLIGHMPPAVLLLIIIAVAVLVTMLITGRMSQEEQELDKKRAELEVKIRNRETQKEILENSVKKGVFGTGPLGIPTASPYR